MDQVSMFHTLNSRRHTNVFFICILKGKHGKLRAKVEKSPPIAILRAQTWTLKGRYINIRFNA